MKASDETSSRAKPPAGATASPPLSPPPVKRFGLTGPSARPDPAFNAYRSDVADVELAGQVVASHFAEPLFRKANAATPLLRAPDAAAEGEVLDAGAMFAVLDCARGLAWGYRVSDHRVGYVDQDVLESA